MLDSGLWMLESSIQHPESLIHSPERGEMKILIYGQVPEIIDLILQSRPGSSITIAHNRRDLELYLDNGGYDLVLIAPLDKNLKLEAL